MFRTNQNSEMSASKFGVGSVVDCGRSGKFVVIGQSGSSKSVGLMNLQTCMIDFPPTVQVSDLNHLTEAEVRNLVNITIGNVLNWAFSDFEFDAKGIKVIG